MSIASENAAVFRNRFAPPDSLLRFALRFDAVATGLGGVVLLVGAKWLVEPLGPSLTFQVAHAALLVGYGVVVFALSRLGGDALRKAGIVVAAGNLLGSAVYVIAGVVKWVPLTSAGVALAIAFAVFTALMSDLQLLGLRRLRVRR